MSIGLRIKEQRKKLHLTQPQLADLLGLSLDMIKGLESNRKKPSLETLSKMCETFNCSSDYLLGIEPNESNEESEIERMKREIKEIINNAKTDEEVQNFLFIIKKIIRE